LSILTKILIVLLTFASVILCGIVVTYVGSADDFKQKSVNLTNKFNAAEENAKKANKALEENKAMIQQQKKEIDEQIAALKTSSEELQSKLGNVEREKSALLAEVEKWTTITRDFYQTTEKQGQLLKNTLDELNKLQAEQIKTQKELKETTASLMEKMAIIDTLETDKKRLIEQKTELQSKLDQLLQPGGKAAAEGTAVTPKRDTAQPTAGAGTVREINLKGKLTAVDLKNSMASISLSSADGVKEGMKFYVTRGSEFICDVLISDVSGKQAVGFIELVQQQPKVGDTVSTNL
jgi:myosin heavy subunit